MLPASTMKNSPRTIGMGAIVPAAGLGRRMGADRPKQFLLLSGLPVLLRTIRALAASPLVEVILPVVPEDFLDETRRLTARRGLGKCLPPVAGGAHRQDSVKNGFDRLPPSELVLIHDGARPFLDADLIGRCAAAARAHGAALAAVRPPETVKLSSDGLMVERTLDRRHIWLAQTPQVFVRAVLEESYRRLRPGMLYTDEASLVEAAGFPVSLVEGPPENIKITGPWDLLVARAMLRRHAGTDTYPAKETVSPRRVPS
jgi:2-C-methyl-D-erythritol 4-phosphate cytidylyltransferase